MAMARSEAAAETTFPDDGLPVSPVGSWSEDKYRRLQTYAQMFSTGMKNRWPNRIYIDLFAGPGMVVEKASKRRLLGSPLLALTIPDPFTRYIFCDENREHADALMKRCQVRAPNADVHILALNANSEIQRVIELIPPYSKTSGVLTFCFVDPFDLGIHFSSIRQLAQNRSIDFLILLALNMDANRNWETYCRPENKKIEAFLGRPTWRDDWREAEKIGKNRVLFLAEQYLKSMREIGYLHATLDDLVCVNVPDNNMRLYYLAFFSKSERGHDFWRKARSSSTDQYRLPL